MLKSKINKYVKIYPANRPIFNISFVPLLAYREYFITSQQRRTSITAYNEIQKKYKRTNPSDLLSSKKFNEYLIENPITKASDAMNKSEVGKPKTVKPVRNINSDTNICSFLNKTRRLFHLRFLPGYKVISVFARSHNLNNNIFPKQRTNKSTTIKNYMCVVLPYNNRI